MARNFHTRRTLSAVSEINLTNMIDLGFVLLIIFMISTPLIEKTDRGQDVQLPVAQASSARDKQAQFLDVIIDSQGLIRADGRQVSQTELAQILEREGQRGARARVINVRADFRLQYQQVVTVLDLVKQAGLSRISLETRQQ